MYQSLIKKFPHLAEEKKIQLMRKHYLGKYTGVLSLEGPVISQVLTARRYKNTSSAHLYQWLTGPDATPVYVDYRGQKHDSTPYVELYKRLDENTDISVRDQYTNIRIYFEKLDQMTEFVEWAEQMERQFALDWIKSIQGADEQSDYDQITVTGPNLAKFQYKVLLKDITHYDDIKKLKRQLTQFKNDIKCSGRLKMLMTEKGPDYSSYFFGEYFYCTDEQSMTYMSLAFSQWIKKVYRLNHYTKESE